MFRQRRRKYGSKSVEPEARLWWLRYGELHPFRSYTTSINVPHSHHARTHRLDRLRMDKSRSTTRGPLDSTDDILFSCRLREREYAFLSGDETTDNPFRQYSIYQSSIDYTVAAYGPYAASATGGNDFARDFLSGIATLYSTPSTFLLIVLLLLVSI